MKVASLVGILLIVLGIIGLAYGGITYTRKEKVVDIGPIQATAAITSGAWPSTKCVRHNR